MGNLLDKFNVLVRSSLNNFLTESGTPKVPPERLGKDIDKEVAALRKRIDEALSEEDAMQNRLDQMEQQMQRYDQQADEAVQRGDEANARYVIQQLQRQKQMVEILRSDLEEHKRATSEFIERVNTLDAVVSDARREKGEIPDSEPPERSAGAVLSNLLREARERVENAVAASTGDPAQAVKINITEDDRPGAENAMPTPIGEQSQPIRIKPSDDKTPPKVENAPSATAGDQAQPIKVRIDTTGSLAKPQKSDSDVDDDLAKRRSRLSKPD